MNPNLKTKNLGKHESVIRTALGAVLIILSFVLSGVFWILIGLLGAIIVVSALFKFSPLKKFFKKVSSKK